MFVRREWISDPEIFIQDWKRIAKILPRSSGIKISALRKHEQTGFLWQFLLYCFHCNKYFG